MPLPRLRMQGDMSVLYLRTNLQHAATFFIPLEETVVVALGLP